MLHTVPFVVALLSLPLMLQGKAKERHELFSQGQSLSEIALTTAQVAGKPPTVSNSLHVLLWIDKAVAAPVTQCYLLL